MTIEKEALSCEGNNGQAPRNGAPPGNSTGNDIPRNRSDNVFELVDQLTLEVIHLRIAQRSNRRIGMAMGIVMNQLHVDDVRAFDALRRISQNTNRKLRDVAEVVIADGRIRRDT